jgi:phage terminase large subunit-like protein
MNDSKFKPPEHYWKIAKEYIIKKDKELQKEGKYYIDKQLAIKYIKIGSIFKHTAGSYAGINFQFQSWQIESIIDIFGTKHSKGEFQGFRRYQRGLFFMPKKNGKSEFGALLHLLVFFVDKELAKKQYCIGKSLDQAKLVHNAAVTMIKQEEELNELTHITKKPPKITKMNGAFEDEIEALASDADNQEGKNVSFFTTDEGHTHPNKDIYQIMTDGTAGRDEPLEVHISTAGYNMQGYFYRDIYLYAQKVKQGIIKDEAFYQVMFELDEEDMKDDDFWKDEKLWRKANPNLGASPTLSYMRNKVVLAEQSEESLIAFKTKHLNVWCDKVDIWIKHSVWTANQTPINEDDLKGRLCYAGLDLSSVIDLSCWCLIFPKDSGGYDILPRFFIPEDQMRERVRRDKVPYFDWVKSGLIIVTPGNVIDYDFIESQIKKDCEFFNVKMAAYDRWNSSSLVTNLTNDEVVDLIPFGQGFASMSTPTKQIEVLSLQEKLNHRDNEVLNWNCSNVVLKRDPADNVKIDKEKSTEKVDGLVALAMAIGIAIKDVEEKEKEFVYNERGLIDL